MFFLDYYQSLYGTNDLLGSIGGFMLVKRYPLLRYKRKILFTFEDLMGTYLYAYKKTADGVPVDKINIFFLNSIDWWNSWIIHWI